MGILVTGGAGQVGTELAALAGPSGVVLHLPDRAELDLSDPASVARAATLQLSAEIVASGVTYNQVKDLPSFFADHGR